MNRLEECSKIMIEKEINQWEIGWESLPKYIGHKIYNNKTNEIAIVNWDNGYPEYITENNERKYFCCDDFRHNKANWIYRVGEQY